MYYVWCCVTLNRGVLYDVIMRYAALRCVVVYCGGVRCVAVCCVVLRGTVSCHGVVCCVVFAVVCDIMLCVGMIW